MKPSAEMVRFNGSSDREHDGFDDAAAALLIHTGYAFDVILILVGLIAVATGHVAGGLGVAGLGAVALAAGWLVVEVSDHFHR